MGSAVGSKKRARGGESAKEAGSKGRVTTPRHGGPHVLVHAGSSGLGLMSAGGPAVALAGGVQRKVTIGEAGDRYEREADRVAGRVASGLEAPAISSIGPGGLGGASGSPAQALAAEDEEPVQAKLDDESDQVQADFIDAEEPVQAMSSEDEEPVQPKGLDEEEPVQASGEGGPAAIAARAIEGRGAGRPLDAGVRSRLEPAFGADLGHVRVHDGPQDREAAAGINARAFTHGSDIWLGHGESDHDVRLMAHEMTHVFQQGAAEQGAAQQSPGGAVQTFSRGAIVQREDADEQGDGGGGEQTDEQEQATDAPAMTEATGVLEGEDITFSQIEVPMFKVSDHRATIYERDLQRARTYTEESRRNTRQREVWQRDLGKETSTVETALQSKYEQAYGAVTPGEPYVFKAPSKYGKNKPLYFIGELPQIAKALTLPQWDRAGEPHSFDVDHVLELQLANWPEDRSWANTVENMELLDSSVNRSSGSVIKQKVEDKVRTFIQATDGRFGDDAATIKRGYNLKFNDPVGGNFGQQPGPNDFWTKEEIKKGDHLGPVAPANLADIGGNGKVRIFPSEAGHGLGKQFSLRNAEGKEAAATSAERDWLSPFVIKSKRFVTEGDDAPSQSSIGSFKVNVKENDDKWQPFPEDKEIPIHRWQGARYAGYIDKAAVRAHLRSMRVKRLSPIRVDYFDVLPEGGLYAIGAILPETPLIGDLDLGFELSGSDFSVYKEFRPGDFNVPAPFVVRDSSLTLAISTERGFVVEGQIDFAIEGAGEGYVRGVANSRGGLELQGSFSFDTDLFEQAEIDLWYRDDAFGARGTLVIGPRKVRGIRSGRITAEYASGLFSAEGEVAPDIPGIEQGRMSLSFSEQDGLTIGGGFTLSQDVPGIRSGSIDVTVRKGEDGWKVSAEGSAQPDIPGVDTSLSVSYDDGLFTIQGSAEYERGMMKGRVELGVTNRPVDDSGEPSGEPGDTLRAFGGGSVTVRIAPWLQGTVGLRLLENGEIEISGQIGFPDTIELFERLAYEKDILRPPPLDIPIIGVAAAGRRIGIFATIRGGLEAEAGIGPGVLRNVSLGITYNPDHEDQTHVTGSAELHVPASAGLRLYVQGGIGAGIPIVSATAGLEVGGRLGLEGALNTGVNIDWTPAEGLKIDALGELYVQPKFVFNIEAFVNVELDLLLKTITLYERSWELARMEFGSNLRFGVKFPVHYEEGKPFDISLSDVEFIVPDVDVKDLISDLVDAVV